MLENLRRKSLVKTYIDPIHQVHFEQGHVIYLDSCSIAEHKQKLSTKKVDKSFPSTFDGVSKEFRLIPNALKDVKFNMIYCPSGTFEMGYENLNSNTLRQETIERPFLLGETEITQALYKKVVGDNPSEFKNSQNPVEMVSWEDAIKFCNKLSDLQGLDPCYTKNLKSRDYGWDCDFTKNGYRLPKEKEWEYAAKAGTENRWAGTDNWGKIKDYAWLNENSQGKPHRVATKKPNEWGFYDMSGNVQEICWDKYNWDDLKPDADRVGRGGLWSTDAVFAVSAYRYICSLSYKKNYLGFRVCRSIVN